MGIDEQPVIRLSRWKVYRVDGFDHFVGYCWDNLEGRVSSRIINYNIDSRGGITKSGRVYKLEGPPDIDYDARYVFERWCTLNKAKDVIEVTKEYM